MRIIFMNDAVTTAERKLSNNGGLQRRSKRHVAGDLSLHRLDWEAKTDPEARLQDQTGGSAVGMGDHAEEGIQTGFASFCELYEADRKPRLKESTCETKDHMIRTKLLPYFGHRKIAEIDAKEVIAWQNKLIAYRDKDGKGYSPDYLRSVHAQLSAIFNHAVKYYKLPVNPARVAGTLGLRMRPELSKQYSR